MDLPAWYSTSVDTESRPMSQVDHDAIVARYCESVYEEALDDLSKHEEISNVDRAISYLIGKQWTERRPSYKAAPVANRLWSNMVQLVSFLTDTRQSFQVNAGNRNFDTHANIINKCVKAWYYSEGIDMTMAMIIIHAALTIGYGRLVWNPDLKNGDGEFELVPLGCMDLIPIRPQHHLQRCYGVIYRMPKPLSFFQDKYPLVGHLVPPDTQYSKFVSTTGQGGMGMWGRAWQFLSPQFKRLFGQQGSITRDTVIPMAMYREFWIRDDQRNKSNQKVWVTEGQLDLAGGKPPGGYWVEPGAKYYPRGRLIVMGGPVVVYDGPNPHWHGQFPFIALRLNRVPWQWPGISEFRNQIPLQDIMNNVLAGILDAVKKAVNPALTAPSNAFSPAVQKSLDPNMPNAKIWYSPASPFKPEYQQSPSLPGFVFQTLLYAQGELDSQTGFIDPQSLARRGIIPAADTLEQMKEGQQTIVRLKTRYIEQFHQDMGSQMVPNIFQFYTMQRRVQMLGTDGLTWEDFDWNPGTMVPANSRPEDHWRQFTFYITPGTLLQSSRVPQQVKAMQLRRQGDMDLKTLYDFLDLGSIYEKVKMRLEDEGKNIFLNMLKQMKAKMGGGGGVSPDVLRQAGQLNSPANQESPEMPNSGV